MNKSIQASFKAGGPGVAPPLRPPDKRLPLLWRAFIASALIMVAAAALLVVTPVTIHTSVTTGQFAIVLGGLLLMLVANLWSLRKVLAPLRKLTALMARIDPDQPGQRITDIGSYGPDVAALSDAFNQMLDRLERERYESSRVALAAQESERRRLAGELHDEIGQTLTAAAIQIEHAGDLGHDSSADLRRIADAVRGSLDEVRRIARELRPEALDDLGLINALISLCSRLASQGDLRIERRLEKLPPIPPDLELVIYRVAQESLTNVVRHARATEAIVSLAASGQTVTLTVVDNGRGLPADLPAHTAGISGMRERARLVHGKLELDSKLGAGTTVHLELPSGEGDAGPA
ncbi:MAG TPA: HAMP domain-containing sensor histidine kinase [Solirubrobacterales bacterium]|nr:HAMP domain-containing sensor histidine kinase [Solirubrobacterales bacterium]